MRGCRINLNYVGGNATSVASHSNKLKALHSRLQTKYNPTELEWLFRNWKAASDKASSIAQSLKGERKGNK